MASAFGRLNYNFDDTKYGSSIYLTTDTKEYLNTYPLVIKTWQKNDIANGNIQNYTVGGKTIKVKLQTDDTILPGFPRMFSTKKDKLIITGQLPDFSQYFDNSSILFFPSNLFLTTP